jgi:hypothetical protein
MLLPTFCLLFFFVRDGSAYLRSEAVLAANLTTAGYDGAQAMRSLYLSSAAYCDPNTYLSRTFVGPTAGFVATNHIADVSTDTQGYVGYLPSDKSIYVVFRGSTDTRNWITNLNALKMGYTTYPECNCQVHKGFYQAEQKVITSVIAAVKALQIVYPSYSVKVAGHSLGAALAQLASMDLMKAGISNTVYDFGQPRTGDKAYAAFAASKVPTWRVTHNRDQVPHLPFTVQMEFYHVCREEFEDANGKLRTCDTSCEDATCADQYDFAETNWDDHSIYLGMHVSCSSV